MKILVIHASAGAGHMKAAEAIRDGIQKHTGHTVILSDALDFSSPFYKKLYQKTYLFLISKLSFLWAFLFYLFDLPMMQPFVKIFRRFYNGIHFKRLEKYLVEEQFNYIFSTHFMSTEISAALKEKGHIVSYIITCVTDFDVHRFWLADGVDFYTVASDWTKEKMKKIGISEEKVLVTGIPVNERFQGPFNKPALQAALGLNPDMFTVLIATGSFGIGPIEQIIQSLKGIQVVVVCGHGQKLYRRLNAKQYENVRIFGLVDNMHELMAVVDVMVTKPGGLSISEALVCQLPLIFFNVIPGQERFNVRIIRAIRSGELLYSDQRDRPTSGTTSIIA